MAEGNPWPLGAATPNDPASDGTNDRNDRRDISEPCVLVVEQVTVVIVLRGSPKTFFFLALFPFSTTGHQILDGFIFIKTGEPNTGAMRVACQQCVTQGMGTWDDKWCQIKNGLQIGMAHRIYTPGQTF